jgi:outer membrane protein assembly factor BamB
MYAMRVALGGVCLFALAACGHTTGSSPSSASSIPDSLYYVGSDGSDTLNDALYALRAANGQQRWSLALSGNEHGQAVAAGGIIYVGGEVGPVKSGPAGLTAVRAQDGKQLWQDKFGGFFATTPIAGDGAVYTSTWTGVYALRPSDGHLLWRLTPSQPWLTPPQIALAQGTLYAAVGSFSPDTSATLYALRPSDGSVLWHFTPPNSADESDLNLTPGGANVYLNTTTNLYVLHATDGTLAWSMPSAGGNLAIANDALYLVTGSGAFCTPAEVPVTQITTVVARSTSDGAVLWTTHVNGVPAFSAGPSPFAASDEVYANVQTGTTTCKANSQRESPFTPTVDTLYALGTASGAVLWHATVSAPLVFTAMQETSNVLYAIASPIGPGNGTLYAFTAGSGAILWQRNLAGPGFWLELERGALYSTSTVVTGPETWQTALYALRPADGSTLWAVQVEGGAVLPPALSG